MRKQYHFKPSSKGYYAWDVDKLIELSKEIPVELIPLSEIRELDEPYWYGDKSDIPTCRSIVAHMKLIQEVDISYPIILGDDHSVLDGMHRVARSLLVIETHIKAKILHKTPSPDSVDIYPDELEYK